MNKECQSAPAIRKRRPVTKTPITKTARLEEKLDGLISLLQSAAQSLPVGTSYATGCLGAVPSGEGKRTARNLSAVYCAVGYVPLGVVRFLGSCFVVRWFVGSWAGE